MIQYLLELDWSGSWAGLDWFGGPGWAVLVAGWAQEMWPTTHPPISRFELGWTGLFVGSAHTAHEVGWIDPHCWPSLVGVCC